MKKPKHRQNWYYSCHAIAWWGEQSEHVSFRYTEGGKSKMRVWMDEHLEADWRVSIKLVRKRK